MNNRNGMTKLGGRRDSNLELYRILCMLSIVAHHYVVNSGLTDILLEKSVLNAQDYFLLLFGCGGKIGINCFVLITGYYMCRSQVTLRKWLRLFGEVEFYNVVIYAIFVLTGYEAFSIRGVWTVVFPITSIKSNFTGCYLLFYGFIPFLNRLIGAMNEREHRALLGLCLLIYTVLPSFLFVNISFNYITWFCIVYLLAAYLRLYPRECYRNTRLWTGFTMVSILLAWASIVFIATVGRYYGIECGHGYWLVSDANKVLAVAPAVCSFMLFKNIRMPYSRFINTIAASTFGVLLPHTARAVWLWSDICRNVDVYGQWWLPLHAIGSVAIVYIVCTGIDMVRRLVSAK